MLINENTTLEELHEVQRHCMDMKEKTMGIKTCACFECEYFAPYISCEFTDITGKFPYEWVLPIVDYQ